VSVLPPQYFQVQNDLVMIFTLDIYTLLKVLAVLQGLIFTILLIQRAWMQERYSDYWLAALLFIFSAYLLH
jgi:hypothetical protein